MIYITHRYTDFDNVQTVDRLYKVDCNNVEEKYIEFMLDKAKELDLVVNPHWLNAMNFENNNTHLSLEDYKVKVKEWKKILRQWNIHRYITEVLKGTKLDYKQINRF